MTISLYHKKNCLAFNISRIHQEGFECGAPFCSSSGSYAFELFGMKEIVVIQKFRVIIIVTVG
jgi:hypothetical protein